MSEDFGNFLAPPPEGAPTLAPLDDEARRFVEEAAELARDIALPDDMTALSELFDDQRRQWYATPEAQRPDPNGLIAAVGSKVAESLKSELQLDWLLFTDANGTDIALVVEAERLARGESLYLFPFDAVAGRWEEQEPDGGVTLYHRGVVETVREEQG